MTSPALISLGGSSGFFLSLGMGGAGPRLSRVGSAGVCVVDVCLDFVGRVGVRFCAVLTGELCMMRAATTISKTPNTLRLSLRNLCAFRVSAVFKGTKKLTAETVETQRLRREDCLEHFIVLSYGVRNRLRFTCLVISHCGFHRGQNLVTHSLFTEFLDFWLGQIKIHR